MMRCWSLLHAEQRFCINRSVEMAKKYGVELVVRSSLNRSEGTIIKETVKMEKNVDYRRSR